MRWIWWSIHQHKPRTMYLGPAPMLNHCRLSGSEFTLPPFSLWCSWGIWSKSAARALIHSKSFLNWLFGTSWSAMAAVARKNKPRRKTVQIEFLCFLLIPALSDPPPLSRASMICAQGLVTHGSFKKQWGEIFGRSWWESEDVGVRLGWRGLGESAVRQRRCGESAVPLWWQERECRGDKCPSSSPRIAAPQLWLRHNFSHWTQPSTSGSCLENHLLDCFISFKKSLWGFNINSESASYMGM